MFLDEYETTLPDLPSVLETNVRLPQRQLSSRGSERPLRHRDERHGQDTQGGHQGRGLVTLSAEGQPEPEGRLSH